MKIGLFFDYDGVLAPISNDPLKVDVTSPMLSVLRELQKDYVVAVISGRDCPFLYDKIPGLNGYACVLGLEIHGGGFVVFDEEVNRGIKPRILIELTMKIKEQLGNRVGLIIGKTTTGVPIGVSLYWFMDKGKPIELDNLIEEARSRNLVVNPVSKWGDVAEFIEIHISRRTKRESIKILRALLDVDRVVYFGDSYNDIPAFNESDVSVFVKHEYNSIPENSKVDYVVNFNELPGWLHNKLIDITRHLKN